MSDLPTIWRLESPNDLVDREWDGEIVVLNAKTGSTHLLEASAALIYRALQGGPQTDAALIAQLTPELDTASADDAREIVQATLLQFLRLGLIESSPVENC